MKPSQNVSVHFRSIGNLEIQKIKKTAGIPINFRKFHKALHDGRSYKDIMMHALKCTLIKDLYITNTTSCSKIKR